MYRVFTSCCLIHILIVLGNLFAAPANESISAQLGRVEAAFHAGKYREAEAILSQIAASRESQSSQRIRLRILELKAELSIASGKLTEAKTAAQEYLNRLKNREASAAGVNLNESIQAAEVRLATIAARSGDSAAAVSHYERALAIPAGQRHRDPLWDARTHLQLARHTTAGLSRQHTETARSIIQQLIERIHRERLFISERVNAGLLLADVQHRLDETALAEQAIQKTLDIKNLASNQEQIDLLLQLAGYRRILKKYDKAHLALDSAEQILRLADNPTSRADILEQRAIVFGAQGRRGETVKCWQEAAAALGQVIHSPPNGSEKPGSQEQADGARIEQLQRLLDFYSKLARWDEGIQIAEELLKQRENTLVTGDLNIQRAQAALGSFCALAALDPRAATPREGQPKLSRAELISKATELLEGRRMQWASDSQPPRLDLFRALSNLIELYRFKGDFTSALECVAQARPLIRELVDEGSLSRFEVSAFRINCGSALAGQGRFAEALEEYRLAATDSAHEMPWKVMEMRSLANLNSAMLLRSQGQLDEAEKLGQEAYRLRLSQGTASGEQLIPFSLAMGSIELAKLDRASASAQLGGRTIARDPALGKLLAEAVRWASEAQRLLVEGKLEDTQLAPQVYHLRAQTLLQEFVWQGDEASDEPLKQAQALWAAMEAQAAAAGLKAEVARSLSCQLDVAMRRYYGPAGDQLPHEAEALSLRAYKLVDELQAYPNLCCQVMLQRAQILLKLAERSTTFLEPDTGSLPANATTPRPDASDCRKQAIVALERALTLVEMPRASTTGADQERAEFYAYFSPIFDLLIDTYVANGQIDKALQSTEWRRSRTLLDQLRVAHLDSDSAPGPEDEEMVKLRRKERAAILRLQQIYAEARAFSSPMDQSALASRDANGLRVSQQERSQKFEQINRSVEVVRSELVNLRRVIHQRRPFYRNILAEGSTEEFHAAARASLHDLLSTPADAGSGPAVLVYHIGRWRSHLFIFGGGIVVPLQFPLTISDSDSIELSLAPGALTPEKARMLVSRLLSTAIDDMRGSGKVVESPLGQFGALDEAHWLAASRVLLPPAAIAELRRLKPARLTVVPDGPLHQLSLEMLLIDKSTYVIDELPPIHYVPSALIAQAIAERAPVQAGRSLLLTVAPTYTGERVGMLATGTRGYDFVRLFGQLPAHLPKANEESQRVSELFARLAGRVRIERIDSLRAGAEPATEEEVVRRISGARFVHFAAHGRVEEHYDNLFGGLLLTPQGAGTGSDDGVLSLYDIERLKLRGCELVILSACETNRGPDRPLEAGSTLARAFLASGADRVVCSQWEVDDESTKELIVSFVDRITQQIASGGSVDYARALHESRRQVRNHANTKWRHPHYWAPFILVGPAVAANKPLSVQPDRK